MGSELYCGGVLVALTTCMSMEVKMPVKMSSNKARQGSGYPASWGGEEGPSGAQPILCQRIPFPNMKILNIWTFHFKGWQPVDNGWMPYRRRFLRDGHPPHCALLQLPMSLHFQLRHLSQYSESCEHAYHTHLPRCEHFYIEKTIHL